VPWRTGGKERAPIALGAALIRHFERGMVEVVMWVAALFECMGIRR